MNEQEVPNLDEMNEQEASYFLTELLPKLSPKRSTRFVTRTT